MDTTVREFFGLLVSVLVLAGLAIVIGRGEQTARILTSGGSAFARIVNAATRPAR